MQQMNSAILYFFNLFEYNRSYNFCRLSKHSAKILHVSFKAFFYSNDMFKALSIELCIKSSLKLHCASLKCVTRICIFTISGVFFLYTQIQ